MKLIDKSELVEELKKLKQNLSASPIVVMEDVESLIESLEAKEVDLEKEFYDFLDTLIGKDNGHLSEDELFRIARHFFELGLKAQTDAFIEKACEWLSKVSIEDMTYKYNNFDTSEGWYKFIDDFKNYMKGE